MALTQNTSIDSGKLILGNCKIESAASAAASYSNLGNGVVTAAGHNLTKFDVQGRNGPDPVEGISDETFTISGELIEYDGSVLSAIQCGAISESNTSVLSTINGGGNTVLTPRAFKLTNTSVYSGSTVETIMTVYKGTLDTGIQFTFKGDQDSDPVAVMPFTITAKNDESKTAGSQLFQITRTIV